MFPHSFAAGGAAGLLLALLAGGCATARPPQLAAPDADAVVRTITLCVTTEADLRRQLGPPTRDGRLRQDRIVSWITREATVVSYLAVLLDARGTVVDLYWNLPTEIPWVPASQCAR